MTPIRPVSEAHRHEPADYELGEEYRKTATIRAIQWHKMGDHPAVILKSDRHRYADEGVPWIDTLEGGHVVTPGDWIATGIRGEHWPIKPDIFAATYECVSEHRPADYELEPNELARRLQMRLDAPDLQGKNTRPVTTTELQAIVASLATRPAKVDDADLDAFRRIEAIIERHNGRQSEKVDDARLIARQRIAALTALTQSPRSCCSEVSATDTEAMRLLREARDMMKELPAIGGSNSKDRRERKYALIARIDALAKGGA